MALISFNHKPNYHQLIVYCCTLIVIWFLTGIDSNTESKSTINSTNYYNLTSVSLSNQFKSLPSTIDGNLSSSTTDYNLTLITNESDSDQLRNESTISIPSESTIRLSPTDYPINCANSTDHLTVINNLTINSTLSPVTLINNNLVDSSIVPVPKSSTSTPLKVMMISKSDNDTNSDTINNTFDFYPNHNNDSVNDDDDNQVKIKLNATERVESLFGKNLLVNDDDDKINGTVNDNNTIRDFKDNHDDDGLKVIHDETTSTQISINFKTTTTRSRFSTTTGTNDINQNDPSTRWSVHSNSDNNGNNNNDDYLPYDNEYPLGIFDQQQHHQQNYHHPNDENRFDQQVKSSTSQQQQQQHSYNYHHHNQCHFNPLTLYLSSGFSLILILVTMVGQMSTMITCHNHWKSCYILLNLLISLALIEIIFLFGGPLQPSSPSSSSSSPSSLSHLTFSSSFWTPCKVISMILHYLHLVAAFTMLSYSIYLFKKLWRFHEDIMITDVHNETLCYSDTIGSTAATTTILPIIVTNNNSINANNNNNGQQQQQLSESIQSSSNQNQYYHQQKHYHSHYQTRQQPQSQHQPIQRSQSLSSSSSYSSLPYPSSSDSCENALITWNQPNLHKEPESRQIVHLLLFTWAGPLLCIVTSNLINPLGYETKRYCWMSIEGGMMFSFIVPVSILIMSNTITMLLILKRFFFYKPITHKIEIERVEPSLRSGVSLLPFFAVNWFLSVLALEDTATDIFQYLFAFSNLIQHLLVFLFHCYQRPEIYQRFSMYLNSGDNGCNRISKSSLKSKHNYWCSGHCATVPLLIYSDDGSARLYDNCFDDLTIEASRFKDQ